MDPRDRWPGDSYRLETPERIDLEYDLAGLGSRFLAALIDTPIVMVIATLVLGLGTWSLGSALEVMLNLIDLDLDWEPGLVAFAAALLLTFAVIWGYFVFFEVVWQGQSPGKRLVGLRVIKEGGYPLGFVDSVIRNVVRLVDFLPSYYMVGIIVMLLDPRSRRLGDLAAGTVVVKERRELRVTALDFDRRAGSPSPATGVSGIAEAESPIPNLARLTPADQSLLREYFLRRSSLAPPSAGALAARLATAFAQKLDY